MPQKTDDSVLQALANLPAPREIERAEEVQELIFHFDKRSERLMSALYENVSHVELSLRVEDVYTILGKLQDKTSLIAEVNKIKDAQKAA